MCFEMLRVFLEGEGEFGRFRSTRLHQSISFILRNIKKKRFF